MEPTVTLLISEYDRLRELNIKNNHLEKVIKELRVELSLLRGQQFIKNNKDLNDIDGGVKIYIKYSEDGNSITYSTKKIK